MAHWMDMEELDDEFTEFLAHVEAGEEDFFDDEF